MFRIVQVNRSESVSSEFVLLQNQGNMRLPLRGLTVMSDLAIADGQFSLAHVFSEEALVPPGAYVLLHSGRGESAMTRCRDGIIYRAFMNREECVWSNTPSAIHVMSPHHTFVERRQTVSNYQAIENLALSVA